MMTAVYILGGAAALAILIGWGCSISGGFTVGQTNTDPAGSTHGCLIIAGLACGGLLALVVLVMSGRI